MTEIWAGFRSFWCDFIPDFICTAFGTRQGVGELLGVLSFAALLVLSVLGIIALTVGIK